MSTPSWIVLASVWAGSTCAKRARSSSASTRRCTRSACARCHVSVRSLTERFLKLSYSAASRRYLSFMSASSPSRRTTASSDGSINAPDSASAGCSGGCGFSGLSFMVLGFISNRYAVRDAPFWLAWWRPSPEIATRQEHSRVGGSCRASGRLQPTGEEGQGVAERGVALWVVQHLVIHLRIPADEDRALQAVGEGARQVRIDHAVLAREQEQEGRLDAVPI